MNKQLLAAFLSVLAASLSAPAAADAFASVRYDAHTDELVATMIYRGTNPDHTFTLQWDACPDQPNSRHRYEIGARVLDSKWNDEATQPFRKVVRFSLADLACRPAQVTLWTAPRFRYTVLVPRTPKSAGH